MEIFSSVGRNLNWLPPEYKYTVQLGACKDNVAKRLLTVCQHMILLMCCRLQELEVSFCDQMTDKGLLKGIGALQELYSLRLKRGHNLTASALSMFLHRPVMACIVCLNLSECSNLDDHGVEGIANRYNKLIMVFWVTSYGLIVG